MILGIRFAAVPASVGVPVKSRSAKTLVNVQNGLKFASSPRWFGQELLFLDIHDRCIKSADLSGVVQTVKGLPFIPGSFEVLENGVVIVSDVLRRKIYRWEESSYLQIADLGNEPGRHLSDGIVDSRGGMYVGDFGFDFLDPLIDPVSNGVIVYIGSDGISRLVAKDLFYPSGMIISPDNKTLVVAETMAHQLTAFEIQNDGSLRNRSVWAQFQDEINPYGICADLDGAIWVAGAGLCAMHVREGGKVDQQINTDRPVFATALGGPKRQMLFMCTSESSDPVITRQHSSATIDIAEVAISGYGAP